MLCYFASLLYMVEQIPSQKNHSFLQYVKVNDHAFCFLRSLICTNPQHWWDLLIKWSAFSKSTKIVEKNKKDALFWLCFVLFTSKFQLVFVYVTIMFYYKNDVIIFSMAVVRNSLRRLQCNACVCSRQKELAKSKHSFSWQRPFLVFIFYIPTLGQLVSHFHGFKNGGSYCADGIEVDHAFLNYNDVISSDVEEWGRGGLALSPFLP